MFIFVIVALILDALVVRMQAPTSGQVFVCTNKWCREKGSDATMASIRFLTPTRIPVQGVNCLGRCNKGPNLRILTVDGAFVEVCHNNVHSS